MGGPCRQVLAANVHLPLLPLYRCFQEVWFPIRISEFFLQLSYFINRQQGGQPEEMVRTWVSVGQVEGMVGTRVGHDGDMGGHGGGPRQQGCREEGRPEGIEVSIYGLDAGSTGVVECIV